MQRNIHREYLLIFKIAILFLTTNSIIFGVHANVIDAKPIEATESSEISTFSPGSIPEELNEPPKRSVNELLEGFTLDNVLKVLKGVRDSLITAQEIKKVGGELINSLKNTSEKPSKDSPEKNQESKEKIPASKSQAKGGSKNSKKKQETTFNDLPKNPAIKSKPKKFFGRG